MTNRDENYGPNETTVPTANTFTAIRGDDEWLKRYLPDGHNSHIGNVPNRVEIMTEDSEEWYRILRLILQHRSLSHRQTE